MSAASPFASKPSPRFAMSLFEGVRGVTRADFVPGLLAGITLAALAIPLNIGYAQVAGLPPVVGLYTAIFPIVVFAIFCSSRQLVASPDAPIAALIGSLLGALAAPSDPKYVELAYAQALVCAVVFFVFWLFKLGFLANFLSKSVMSGFVTGLGIEVFTSQLKKIMDVSIDAEGYFHEVWALIKAIPDANLYSVCLGIGTFLFVRVLKRYVPKLPLALIALIIATALVAVFDLDKKHNVSVLGSVPSGLPSLHVPDVSWGDYLNLIPGAIAICGVTLADALLVGRSYAEKNGYKLDANQEMFAFGAANVAAGFTGAFTTGSSASRTAAMDGSGSRNQIPSFVSAVSVALVLLFLTGVLAKLPNCVLGAIVANAVLSLIEIPEIRELWKIRRDEAVIAIVCALSVLTLGSLKGVIIAFLISAIDVVRRASAPPTAVLGGIDGQPGFYSTERHPEARTIPGLLIYRFTGPLFFANAQAFHDEVANLVETTTPPVEWFVLDAEGIDDVDTTGADALRQVIDLLKKRGITFGVSRLAAPIRAQLATYEILDQIGEDKLYRTNEQAAATFAAAHGQPSPAGASGN
jgi:sulfate permease, SulP family